MSRPFSYSDENFTVIGNVLFCHIYIKKKILKYDPIVEIPTEIYARMLFSTQKFNCESYALNVIFNTNIIDVGVTKLKDKKYYLFAGVDIKDIQTYLTGYFILKDI